MTKIFKRRRNIERATMFRVEYLADTGDSEAEYRDFKTIKSLSQWIERNSCDVALILNRFALIDDTWEPYTTIGKKTITLSDLKNIVRNLEDRRSRTNSRLPTLPPGHGVGSSERQNEPRERPRSEHHPAGGI